MKHTFWGFFAYGSLLEYRNITNADEIAKYLYTQKSIGNIS